MTGENATDRMDSQAEGEGDPWQFSVSSLLALTILASIVGAFLRPYGDRNITAATIAVSVAIAIGALAGLCFGSLPRRIYWAVVACVIIQIVTTNVDLLNPAQAIVAWPIVAAVPAALIGAGGWHLIAKMGGGAAFGALAYAAYVLVAGQSFAVMMPELLCAPIGGALLAVLIATVDWLERHFKLPPLTIAFAQVLAAIAFSIAGSLLRW